MALVVLAAGLLAARLSTGPLSLGLLEPVLERLVQGRLPVRFAARDITLDWQQWSRGPQVAFVDLDLRSQDGGAGAQVRRLQLTFSPQAMANGLLALSQVQIDGGTLQLTRSVGADQRPPPAAGTAPDDAYDLPGALDAVVDDLSGPPHGTGPLGHLRAVAIRDFAVALRDPARDTTVVARIDRGDFTRGAHGLAGTLAAVLVQPGTEPATLALTIGPDGAEGALAATLTIQRLRPALLAAVPGAPPALAALDLPLDGIATLRGAARDGRRSAAVELRGGPGRLVLDPTIAASLGVEAAAQALSVRSLGLKASWRGAGADFEVSVLDVAFAQGTVVYVPAPVDHRFPLLAVSGRGRLEAGRLELKQVVLDLQGPTLAVSGDLEGVPDAPRGRLEIVGTGIRVEHFRRYWPPTLAPGGYQWCTEHLADGVVPELRMQVDLAQRDGQLALAGLRGGFDVERLSVDYLPPMPPIRNARGRARFDEKSLDITVNGATAAGLAVRGGRVLFPDLDRDVPSIRIDANIAGPLPNALAVLASKPLEYAQRFGLEPAGSSGTAVVDLRLAFPLLKDLRVADLDVAVAADLADVSLDLQGIPLRQGNGRLDVTPERLQVEARLAVGPALGDLVWTESFVEGATPRSRMRFQTERVDIAGLRKELADPRLDALLLGGSFAGSIEAALTDGGGGAISGQLDITRSSLALPPLGWSKEAGAPGSVAFDVELDAGRVRAIPRLVVQARTIDLKGALGFDSGGGLASLDVDTLTTGRTDVAAKLTRLADGSWDALIGGRSLDLAPALAEARDATGPAALDGDGALPDFTLAADVDTVWFGADAPISRAMATVVHHGQSWSPVQVQGTLQDGSTVDLTVLPDDEGVRTVSMTASNAGEALRAFAIFPDMQGGDLSAHGRIDDRDPSHPLVGKLRVRDYYIVKMPLLARLLSVLALTGIRDALTGRGIAFSHLDLPFEAEDGVVRIINGRAYGSALGVTASGSIDRDAGTIALQGELVPFYAVNSALGRVPGLGEVMTGGEKGGGVFSASYSVEGPLGDPAIRVNPVTVLLPGFVRYLLETFQGWTAPESPGAGEPAPVP